MSFDFVSIDFETANRNNNSACSMGIVAVKDMNIVETQYFLIQPPTLDFDVKHISIHGITPEAVQNSPKFPEVWMQIKHYFEENMIIAHNAQFDMSVLKCCLLDYNLELPNFCYLCSIPISTKACQGEGISNSLSARAEYFSIDIGEHHNALSDAVTCAKLVIESVKQTNKKSFQSFCRIYGSLPIRYFSELQAQNEFSKRGSRNFQKINISEITAATTEFNTDHVFYGKNFVFTGELKSMERDTAMQKVVDLGGIVKSGVSGKTDYLVVGIQDKSLVGDDGLSTKEEKAYELMKKGCGIRILTEEEFLDML